MKRHPERIALRVGKSCLEPADGLSADRLSAKGYHVGDIVFATLKKPRNPGFHRLAHALGKLVSENIDDFHGMSSHATLKRLQLEADVACDSIAYRVNGMTIVQRIPRSLSFESLDEAEFHEAFAGMCRHLAATYWPSLSAEEIAGMAEMMPESV